MDTDQARAIVAALPKSMATVGVFVDSDYDTITEKVEQVNFSVVQLHGKETPDLAERLALRGVTVIKALFVDGVPDLASAADFHVNGYLVECSKGSLPGGNAMVWDWAAAREFGQRYPLVLAGGLSPDNVADAIADALPVAVDVSSGVEASPGRKGPGKGCPVSRFGSKMRIHGSTTFSPTDISTKGSAFPMKFIGAHVSAAGGVENAPLNAKKIGATAFALFTKNQRQWQAKPLTDASIEQFKKNCADAGYEPENVLPHDSYLINLGHPEAEGLEKSRQAFMDEMTRCQQLGLIYLNFHPGSHLNKISESECLARIAESINLALAETSGVTAVIENTAGQGTNVGYCFEHLAEIIDKVTDSSRVGVCLDTCPQLFGRLRPGDPGRVRRDLGSVRAGGGVSAFTRTSPERWEKGLGKPRGSPRKPGEGNFGTLGFSDDHERSAIRRYSHDSGDPG